mmetsp:Transcript_44185/g.120400  ORF Transcript_44185/g.120400 Transcript_44185/m.120400 type:complete len:192 (+) Transcript_44185:654-1229(+)
MALLRSPSRAVRKEAAFALVNVTTSPWPQHTLRLVEQGVVAPICELLSPSEPSDIVTVALEGLQNILKIGETTTPNPDAMAAATGTQPDGGKVSKGAAAVTHNDMIRTVTAADGKARMMALRHHHRTGAINNISTVLLKTYFDATGLETPTQADESGSTAAATAAAAAAATSLGAAPPPALSTGISTAVPG